MQTRTIYSPILIFLIFLIGVEVFGRLPFVLYLLNQPSFAHWEKLHFFSIYAPGDVIFLGISLLLITFIFTMSTTLITPARIPVAKELPIPEVPGGIYFVFAVVCAASVLAISFLGADALLTSLSSKRSDLGERGLVWVLVKVANFGHMVIALLYLRYLKYKRRLDQLLIVISFLMLGAVSTVYSQRAILISLILELFYISLLFGRLRLRTVLQMLAGVGLIVILISALRPGVEYGSNTEMLVEGMSRAARSRYFFDFAKLGTVLHWADGAPWLGPAALGFIFEPFFGDQVTFYKEVGPMISTEVYLYRSENGVTPGLLLESILSFGYIFGFVFFFLIILAFRSIEWRLFRPKKVTLAGIVFPILVLSKISLALNSSLGALAFQLVIESVMLVVLVWFLKYVRFSRAPRRAFA